MATGTRTHTDDVRRARAGAPGPADDGHAGLALLERAIGYTRGQLQAVTPPMLSLPTPCADWSLASLLDHMADSLDELTGAALLDEAARSVPTGPAMSPVGAVERLRERACALLGAWSAAVDDDVPAGEAPSGLLACAGALEVAVHGWDVAQATGSREPIPSELARELVPWAGALITEADRPARFDHPLDGPSVGPSSRLLRLLGREP